MFKLVAGLVIFFGVHSISIVARDWRERTVARIGPSAWNLTPKPSMVPPRKIRPGNADGPRNRQADLAPAVAVGAIGQEASHDRLARTAAGIDFAERHVGVTISTRFLAGAEFHVERRRLRTCREHAGRMRPLIVGTGGWHGLAQEQHRRHDRNCQREMCHGLSQIVQADLQISSNASLFSAERRPAIGAPDEMQSTVLASTRLASGIPMWADEQIAADPKSRRTDGETDAATGRSSEMTQPDAALRCR
jgi:hypothetical protein